MTSRVQNNLVAAMAACASVFWGAVDANAASVGISLHFSVLPEDLSNATQAEKRDFLRCLITKRQIETLWENAARPPKLDCGSPESRPLILNFENAQPLVVRP